MKLSLFSWQWIFLRDHFLTIPIPSLVSFFESKRYRVRSCFFWVNDTDTESGLVFLKLMIPRPSPVSIFLGERYRYRVRSRFFKVNDTGTETWSRTPKSTRLQRDETETRSLGVPWAESVVNAVPNTIIENVVLDNGTVCLVCIKSYSSIYNLNKYMRNFHKIIYEKKEPTTD